MNIILKYTWLPVSIISVVLGCAFFPKIIGVGVLIAGVIGIVIMLGWLGADIWKANSE